MTKQLRHTPPYTQQFRYAVPKEYVGKNILDFHDERFSFRPRDYWQKLIQEGDISVNNESIDAKYSLKEADMIRTFRRDVIEPDVDADYKQIYFKSGILVINKPAPLPVHPAGRYYKNSLLYILRENNPKVKFHTIHRLDTWTTGVLLLATDDSKARLLHKQVEAKTIHKVYGVLAKGDFGTKEFTIDEPVGRVNGTFRGTGPDITEAKPAVTKFVPIVKKDDVTFLKAYPITGRTNQIRVHVNVAGGHIVNDPLYSPGTKSQIHKDNHGRAQGPAPTSNNDPRSTTHDPRPLGLHCREMGFKIDPNGTPVTFKAEWPEHFLDFFSSH